MKIIIVILFIFGCSAQEERSPSSSKGACICTMEYKPVCGSDGKTYSNPCSARCENVSFTPGECKKPCACTREFIPVCGSDGRSYPNACTAKCAAVSFEEGECE